MSTREHSVATFKRFQIDLWNLHDRMKAGELILYEKRGEDSRPGFSHAIVYSPAKACTVGERAKSRWASITHAF
jgi:hypothetical protein